MKLELPFSSGTIDELSGKTIVISENHRNESLFGSPFALNVKAGGNFGWGYFEVIDGVLRMVDKKGLSGEFYGLESRNGIVFAVGSAAQVASTDGYERVTLHEQRLLQTSEFGICVSSHIDYEKKTLAPLLGSIRKSGFNMANVVAVVGGGKGDSMGETEGAKVIYQDRNGGGFGGLSAVDSRVPYWLLLHDTCEAERGFWELASKIDIGLCPDVIRLRDDTDDWMGFYSSDFITKMGSGISGSYEDILSMIKRRSRVVVVASGPVTTTGIKDVYGTGNQRMVERIGSMGIKKFKCVTDRRTP